MNAPSQRSTASLSIVLALLCAWTTVARAAPCADLPNPIVVSGSTSIQALLAAASPILSGLPGADAMTLVYKGTGSCSGLATLQADLAPAGACAAGSCLTGTALYWGPDGSSLVCDLPAAGAHVDVTLSDVFLGSCEGITTTNLMDTRLLVNPVAFLVPVASSQTAIDAREAYYVYGAGARGGVAPWIDETHIFRRNGSSGTQIILYKSLRIPIGSSVGVDSNGTGPLLTMVAGSASPEATVGFANTNAGDIKRELVRNLAYRHWGQEVYRLPDSSRASFDKRNVRDGHYPLWGYEHAVVRVDNPNLSRAARLVSYLSGETGLPGADMVSLTAKAGLVPLCAMRAARSSDGGDLTPTVPSVACGCFFESAVAGTSAAPCKTCLQESDCGGQGHCLKSFCE